MSSASPLPPATRARLLALTVALCLVADRLTKLAARAWLDPARPLNGWLGLWRFEYIENAGSFLSLGAGLPAATRFWLWILGVGALLLALLYFALTAPTLPRSVLLALALIIGGGLGNWIDRWLHAGRVVDFVSVGIGPVRTGIFNVADLAIMLGIGWLLVYEVYSPKHAARPPSTPASPQ